MGIINRIADSFRFKDTIIYKEHGDLDDKLIALTRLNKEHPNNQEILNEMRIVNKGLEGEKEIIYQLKKANIGLFVLRDIKIKFEDLSSQIDFIVISPTNIYLIECKNLYGNITVNENGDFIRDTVYNGKRNKIGFYSPIRQVEAQRDVLRKIWDSRVGKLIKILGSNGFNSFRKTLVVVANNDTILNLNKAPKDIKERVIRSDALVRYIENDLRNRPNDEWGFSKKQMEEYARSYLKLSLADVTNYYDYYKTKFKLDENDDFSNNKCPKCGSELVFKNGKYGPFYGCSNYPKCKYIRK